MTRRTMQVIAGVALALAVAGPSAAQSAAVPPRPALGPERAFAPPARVERTLANGLKVVVARFPTVPKVSVALTLRSGLAADPADKSGLAQFVADAAQEGGVQVGIETRQVGEEAGERVLSHAGRR